MENNQNTKSFKFNEKADYVFYLSELIIDLIQKKDRLNEYHNEIDTILKNNPNAKFVNSILYDSLSDKINRLFQYIFNLLGDESKKAVSYRKFRKYLFKQRSVLNITLDELSKGEVEILGDFNNLRNWGLHIPESLYLQKKAFFKMDSKFVMENKKTIIASRYDNFEIEFLIKFREEISDVLKCTEIIFERMKKDYSILIGETFEIAYEENLVKPYIFMKAVEKSWDIQTGKLKEGKQN